MKSFLIPFGTVMTVIFGGGFLIRLIRDSDFYIAELIGGIIGIVILVVGVSEKRKMKLDDNSL